MADKQTLLRNELKNLKERGVSLPRNPQRAALTANSMHNLAKSGNIEADTAKALGLKARMGPRVSAEHHSAELQQLHEHNRAMASAMGESRALSARMQRQSSAVGGDVYAAIPRFYDPMEYWDLSGLPWNTADEGHRHKLRKWLRLYYMTHYLVPILVDIFTRFPLVGMELESKDPKLQDFYSDLFLDQLDYGEFLVNLGREFWVVGEAFPLASFDEDLGIWEREELIIPDDIVIENFPILGSQEMKISPPDYLKRLAQTKSPAREYRMLELSFPDLIPYLRRGEHIPVSPVLLKQVANKVNNWDDHGTPVLLRGLRTLLHEEKLMASQDAIAERLYSPLILAKLGIMDMGDGLPPWIPGPEEIASVRDDFDMALASDFRLMVHHFGLEVTNVFGREQMPRLGDDFDRVERRLMQVFGVNPSLLSAGANTQPYASSALQAEFLNQILRTYQDALKKHFRARALVVAEAQQHYDYEVKGQSRFKIMEDVVVYDEEGNKRIERRPKLLVPDLSFASLDLRDEATERQFLQTLRAMGVPIPDQDLMVGIHWDIKDKVEVYNRELKQKTIAQQQAKVDTYTALKNQNLPIPPDLKAEVETAFQMQPSAPGAGLPQMPGGPGGLPGGPGGPGGGPGEGIVMPNRPPGLGPGGPATVPGGGPPPTTPITGPAGTVPEVSNERRPGMPTMRGQGMPTAANVKQASTADPESAKIAKADAEKVTLRPNQEWVDEGGELFILERKAGAKKRVIDEGINELEIVDGLAQPLEPIPDDEDPSESESESTG